MASTLAMVLPGAGYTALGLAIRFPAIALEQLGATGRAVAYPLMSSSSSVRPASGQRPVNAVGTRVTTDP